MPRSAIHLSPIREKVLERLRDNPGERFERAQGAMEQLASEFKWKDTSVAQALVDLAKMGLVHKERRGRRVFYFFEDSATSPPQSPIAALSGTRTIVYFKDIDGQIMASVTSLPGCFTKGSTLEVARRKIRDMARGYMASSHYNGGAIPQELATESVALTDLEST